MKIYMKKFEGLEERHPMAKDDGKRLDSVLIHHADKTYGGYEVKVGEKVAQFWRLSDAITFYNGV